MKKILFVFLLSLLSFIPVTVHADMATVFTKELDDTVSSNIVKTLAKDDTRFTSYTELINTYPKLKYYVYSNKNSTDINLLVYSGSYGNSTFYNDRVELNVMSNGFSSPNLFIFDSNGNLKSKSSSSSYVSIYNGYGYYYSTGKPFTAFEKYDSSSDSSIPESILNVFNHINTIFSNFTQFLHDLIVPSDTNIISNAFSDFSQEIKNHFKPLFDAFDSIVELFTPETEVNSLSDVPNDFYFITINIPELGIHNVQPFKPYNNSREMIYLFCNSLIVITTVIYLVRRIIGTGDVIQ